MRLTLLAILRQIVKREVQRIALWMEVVACCSFLWARQEPAVEYLPCSYEKAISGRLDVFEQCEAQMQGTEDDEQCAEKASPCNARGVVAMCNDISK
jgi:hypothetical protein